MKHIQTRNGVFETNSSSTHSISISEINSEDFMDTIPLNRNGDVILTGGEFGWGWEKYNDALTKANYCAQDGVDKELLVEVIKEQTGANKVFIKPNGYIDHESEGTARVIKDKEKLRQFIFNKKSWLYIGNDNSHPHHNFYDEPDTVYTHVLKFKEFDFEIKFKSEPNSEELEEALTTQCQRLRYEANSGEFEINPGSWYGGASYYVFETWGFDPFDFENQTITLVHKPNCYHIKNVAERIAEETRLINLPENQFKVHYDVVKIQ